MIRNTNVKFIYNNQADASTISMTNANTSYPAASMLSDRKSKVAKATTNTSTITGITMNLVSGTVYGVILGFTNITSGSITINSQTYTITNPGSDVGAYGTGIYKYSYGNNRYAIVYFTATSTGSYSLSITVTTTSSILEISRLIVGECWSPKFNLSLGYNLAIEDSSKTDRLLSGASVVDSGTITKNVNFSLPYLSPSESKIVQSIQRSRNCVFVSMFPSDSDPDREQLFQLYGRINNLAPINHDIFTKFSTSVSIEEI